MSRTLFDISEDLLALEQILDEVGGDISDAEAEHAVDKWLRDWARSETGSWNPTRG